MGSIGVYGFLRHNKKSVSHGESSSVNQRDQACARRNQRGMKTVCLKGTQDLKIHDITRELSFNGMLHCYHPV
jgi:hypothetical protein